MLTPASLIFEPESSCGLTHSVLNIVHSSQHFSSAAFSSFRFRFRDLCQSSDRRISQMLNLVLLSSYFRREGTQVVEEKMSRRQSAAERVGLSPAVFLSVLTLLRPCALSAKRRGGRAFETQFCVPVRSLARPPAQLLDCLAAFLSARLSLDVLETEVRGVVSN